VIENFEKSFEFVLIDEKGNNDDPRDRGGRTSDGITQKEYNAWCALHHSPSGDVWNASMDTKKAIYFQQYWQPFCDKLPTAIDYLFFDMNVNHGTHQAALILQRALNGDVVADGMVGIVTLQAARDYPNKKHLIDRICDDHLRVYHLILQAHPTDEAFIKGWENRVKHERINAYSMLDSVPALTTV
jgi:lysozyme family protein